MAYLVRILYYYYFLFSALFGPVRVHEGEFMYNGKTPGVGAPTPVTLIA